MKKTKSLGTKQIHPYLDHKLHQRFKRYCAANGQTESSVIEAALTEYLDDAKDTTLILRELGRVRRAIGRLERDSTVIAESLGVYTQLWFAHTPQLPDGQKEAAQALAWDRYQQYVQFVADELDRGHRFIADVVSENIINPDDIRDAVAEEAHKEKEDE